MKQVGFSLYALIFTLALAYGVTAIVNHIRATVCVQPAAIAWCAR